MTQETARFSAFLTFQGCRNRTAPLHKGTVSWSFSGKRSVSDGFFLKTAGKSRRRFAKYEQNLRERLSSLHRKGFFDRKSLLYDGLNLYDER
jgi:hypothetical protein